LAERVWASRAALEGERKYITVLFADIKGSLEILAEQDAEDARGILDPVLEKMIEAVHRYEGIVNQTLGDGVMALFGAPLALEDHALRACYAALAMRRSVRAYSGPLRMRGMDLRIRIGLNSGEVVVRSISNDLRMDYSAVGQTTHLAARMEQMAPPDSILVTRNVTRLTEGLVNVMPIGAVPVKGLSRPVETFELTGIAQGRTRLQAAAARGLTRFVGRDADVQTVTQAQERARQGHGQIVALVGEPGVGKSRLVWEATTPSRLRDWLLLETAAVSYAKSPFRLVAELLKSYLQIEPGDDHVKISEKFHAKLAGLDDTLLELTPAYLALLDVPVSDPAWQAMEAPERRRQVLEAVRRLLLRESQIQPVFIVVEDLHWIDSESQAFLDGLVENLAAARLLLVVTHRPDHRDDWSRHSYYTRLYVAPLRAGSADELLTTLLGPKAELEPLRRRLIELAEGNPLFLEELVRHLVETGLLAGHRRSYVLSGPSPIETVNIPPTVQAVLAARIDRLPPGDKDLLQAAAVIGKNVPFSLLTEIAEEDAEALRERLARLRATELLYESQLFPALEYTFKHGLTHDVAYGSLLHERRRRLHARVVRAIESLYADRLAEHVEQLADHAAAANAWDKAATYGGLAGDKALARSAHQEAAGRLDRAIQAIAHLPETRESLERATDLRLAVRKALFPLGAYARALEHLQEAEQLASRLQDQRRLGRVAAAMAPTLWWMGRHDVALRTGEQALTTAQAIGDVALQIESCFRIAQAYQGLGEYRHAIAFFQRGVDTIGEDQRDERFGLAVLPAVFCRSYLARCLAELGEFREGAAQSAEAIRIAREANHPYSLIAAYYCGGRHDLLKGDLQPAIAQLEEALALGRLHEIAVWSAVTASDLGYAYLLAGRAADGLELLDSAVERGRTMGQVFAHGLRLALRANALVSVGRGAEAEPIAVEALEVARTHQEAGSTAYAWHALATAAAGVDAARARICYAEALQIAEKLGMRPLVAHCHLGLGELHRRTDRCAEADEHLTAASAMYRDMDMRLWLTQAEANLRPLG
jgi:class 3 adenylate cyclase/tetratricopeptide (TPR) repeat protein